MSSPQNLNPFSHSLNGIMHFKFVCFQDLQKNIYLKSLNRLSIFKNTNTHKHSHNRIFTLLIGLINKTVQDVFLLLSTDGLLFVFVVVLFCGSKFPECNKTEKRERKWHIHTHSNNNSSTNSNNNIQRGTKKKPKQC